ncbi:oxidoreductase [Jannaschia pagri]|uniref:Oxidoreductase n=1 Tax=Jannaschia pagri TaxID=2829797 RepID=A0ABQ4NHH4_9RHOB|nr:MULTISPECIES: alpha/beta hydrolase [unclassified Jannaschia]GIT90037.1 oxidoreductase [Jannaschia sp. AI_61]GIT93857.1 oxidoreductase [Jannaschia sp. AI_62]
MWQMTETVDTSAGRVAWGAAGQGPALVLAHGWPWSSYTWHRVIPALARHARVNWYDMPGFGASQKDGPRPASLDTQGEVFAELLLRWGLDQPNVVAHDFGGAATLRAHLLHGCDYGHLILMNVVAMRPWGSAFFDHVGRHVDAFTGLPPHIHAAIVRAYIEGALVRPLPDEERVRLAEPWLSEEGARAFYAQFALADEAFTAEIEPQFGALRCPTSVLWGTDDPWIPLARGQALADRIGTELQPLDGLGHLPQMEVPEPVARALLDILSEME